MNVIERTQYKQICRYYLFQSNSKYRT